MVEVKQEKVAIPAEYVIELLKKDEQTYTVDGIQYPVRCTKCLEPATKKETFTLDPQYRRLLCDPCSNGMVPRLHKGYREPHVVETPRPIKYAEKNGKPLVADLHRIEQREKHSGHNPLTCLPRHHGVRMSLAQQELKSTALGVFRRLFPRHLMESRSRHEQEHMNDKLPFQGMKEVELSSLFARCAILAKKYIAAKISARRAKKNDVQRQSRRINAGLQTNRRAYR